MFPIFPTTPCSGDVTLAYVNDCHTRAAAVETDQIMRLDRYLWLLFHAAILLCTMANEIEFKPGDVVQLKSGGPLMTVSSVGNDAMTKRPRVWCVWFVKEKGVETKKDGPFTPETLGRV